MESEVAEIEAYSKPNEDGRWGVKFNGKWANDWGEMPDWIDRGVVAKVEFEKKTKGDRTFRNIESIESYDEEEEEKGKSKSQNPKKKPTRGDSIIVTASYKNAMMAFKGKGMETDWAQVREQARENAKHMKETLKNL